MFLCAPHTCLQDSSHHLRRIQYPASNAQLQSEMVGTNLLERSNKKCSKKMEGPSKNRPQLARSLSPPLNGGKNKCGQFTGESCQDLNQKGWGYCGNPSKFSHIGGMGISFSLAASLEAPFAQLLEMLSWMWQSKSHRISHCFRHSVCFLQLRQSWICKTRCVFGVFEGRRIILAESTLASPNSFGQDDESSSSSEIHPQIEIKMISKFDKQLCPPRRPGRVHEIHEAIESKWIKCTLTAVTVISTDADKTQCSGALATRKCRTIKVHQSSNLE